jgi:hypothetical protein
VDEPDSTCESCGLTSCNSGNDLVLIYADSTYCTGCLNCCDSCGEWYMYMSAKHWFADICGDCQDDHFACPQCNRVQNFDDSVSSTDSEETFCSRCADRYWTYCGECSEWYADSSNDE